MTAAIRDRIGSEARSGYVAWGERTGSPSGLLAEREYVCTIAHIRAEQGILG